MANEPLFDSVERAAEILNGLKGGTPDFRTKEWGVYLAQVLADAGLLRSPESAVLDACRAYYENLDADADDVLLPAIVRWLEGDQ